MVKLHHGLALLALVSASARADRVLTWDDCVKLASDNNPALRSAAAALVSAQEQTLSNRSGFFPQISGTVGYNYANSSVVSTSSGSGVVLSGGGPASSAASGSYTASVSATQTIFNGLSDLGKVNLGKAGEGQALALLLTAKALVSYNLKTAFENLVFAEKSVRLGEEITKRRDQNLRLVQLRFNDGQENDGSVLLYQAYLKDSKYGELQSRDLVVTAKAQLAQALGLDQYSSIEIEGQVPLTDPPGAPDIRDLALKAPTYLTALYTRDYDAAEVTIARANFFPTLSLIGSSGRSGETWFPENNHWSMGVSLSIPLFNGGRDYYNTKSSIDTRVAAELTMRDTGHQNEALIQQALMAYVESIQKLEVDRSYLKASQVRAEIARADYNNGLMSFQDWDLSETDLINRQKSLLQSEQNRVINEAAWEQSLGRGVFQ